MAGTFGQLLHNKLSTPNTISIRNEADLGALAEHRRDVATDVNNNLFVSAAASARQPLPIGFHPWFNQYVAGQGELSLLFDAKEMYELDDHAIPTGRTQTPTAPPWDDCFRSLKANPVLRWGSTRSDNLGHHRPLGGLHRTSRRHLC